MIFWPWYTKDRLLYIGDGHERCVVKPIREATGVAGVKHMGMRQFFQWPDGSEHAVPVHTVVVDTPEVRREKDLDQLPRT